MKNQKKAEKKYTKLVNTVSQKYISLKQKNSLLKNKKNLLWIGSLFVLLALIFTLTKVSQIRTIRKNTTLLPVEKKDLMATVKSSGQVTSTIDLNLSFNKSDIVQNVYVDVGNKVKKGQILATLKNQNELGLVNQAKGVLQSAQASLEKTLEGASTEEVRIAEVALENAKIDLGNVKKQQDINIENARRALYSSSLEARPKDSSLISFSQKPYVYGTYMGSTEGTYIITMYPSTGGYSFNVSGLGSGSGQVSATTPFSIGGGLSLQFPNGYQGDSNVWIIEVPNKQSSMYTTNLNVYLNAQSTKENLIAQSESVVRQREADLALKKALARPADVKLRQADVLRAQGQLQSALGMYENTIIRSPATGTVTKVDIKTGELSSAMKPVVVVQDVSKLYVEANINESDITKVKIDQPVEFTIDAFGSSRIFKGSVTQVEPSATITDGVVNYKVKSSLDEKDSEIRPGMNANLTIITQSKNGIITIPSAAITLKNNRSSVLVITDEDKVKYKEREIITGDTFDGNMIEVISGLTEGEKIAFVEKKK